jgi:hypothetical protein
LDSGRPKGRIFSRREEREGSLRQMPSFPECWRASALFTKRETPTGSKSDDEDRECVFFQMMGIMRAEARRGIDEGLY